MRSLRPSAVYLAVLGVLLALGPAAAQAEGDPIPQARYPELTESIIDPKSRNEREGALLELRRSPRSTHATVYGQVIGPVFRDTQRTGTMKPEVRREMYATVIAHLADDQPEGEDDEVLLVRDFLPLLAADPELLTLLRNEKLKPIRGRYKGWERILQAVRGVLRDDDATLRRSAVRVSAHCDCIDEAETLAVLYEVVRDAGTTATAEDEASFLAAAESLLKYRFATLSALLKFLGDRAERFQTPEKRTSWGPGDKYRIRSEFLSDVIDLYRAKGGEGIRKAREAALAYGKTVIAKATKPADLLVFFDPENQHFPELQRAAMAVAAPPRMKPAPDAEWAGLLVQALRHSDDGGVLERVIAIVGETFTEPTKATQLLAGAVANRIRSGSASDTLAHRRALASILGSIGLQGDVRAAMPSRLGAGDDGQRAVYYVLIRAFGIVKGGLVRQLMPYYLAVGERKQPQWARLAVAEALGLPGFRAGKEEGPQAAMMLHRILTGQAVLVVKVVPDPEKPDDFRIQGFLGDEIAEAPEDARRLLELPAGEKEDDPAVIAAAIDSLEFYQTDDAARVLGELAADGGEAAGTALKILSRQLSRGSVDAARALAKLLLDAALPEKRIVAVLDAITQASAPTAAEAQGVLAQAVRAVMDRTTVEAVRRQAAGVAVHLGDVKALKRIYLTWNGLAQDDAARKVWGDLLEQLVVVVARSGRADKELAGELRAIATDNRRAFVLGLFDAMGQAADRFELKRNRADLRYEYASVPDGRTRDERRKDLDAAHALYRDLVQEAPAAAKSDLFSAIYDVLSTRAQPEWLAKGETPEAIQLDALKAAADSRSAQLAKDALDKFGDPLTKEPGALTPAQRGELDQTTQRLRALIQKPNGK